MTYALPPATERLRNVKNPTATLCRVASVAPVHPMQSTMCAHHITHPGQVGPSSPAGAGRCSTLLTCTAPHAAHTACEADIASTPSGAAAAPKERLLHETPTRVLSGVRRFAWMIATCYISTCASAHRDGLPCSTREEPRL